VRQAWRKLGTITLARVGLGVTQPLHRGGPNSGCVRIEILIRFINTFVLKSYIHSAAIFSGICHPFCSALSSVVSLYSAAGVDLEVVQSIALSLLSAEPDLIVTRLVYASTIY